MPAIRSGETQDSTGSFAADVAWLLNRAASIATWALVRTVSAGRVALHWLDPRVHGESLRLRSVADGGLARNTNKLALLVVYNRGPLPAFTRSLIEALNRSEFDLAVVSNGELDAATRSYVLDRCRLLIERANIGRDFGGYKDGIAILQRRYPELEKLLLANDSVFYLPQGLDGLLAEFAGEGDVIGVSEIFEHHYHVASFLVCFGKRVLSSTAFRNFWRRYVPIGTRRWVILRGEGGLTETLIAAGFKPRVLYQTGALQRRLQDCSLDRLLSEAQRLPARARDPLLQKWDGSAANGSATRLAEDIASAIKLRNQMHYGGFLFRRHLGMPVVKRDLVYRGIYSLQDVLANLDDLDAPLLEAVTADFRARPDPKDYDPLRRAFYRHGAI
jgi:hypothetical protein